MVAMRTFPLGFSSITAKEPETRHLLRRCIIPST